MKALLVFLGAGLGLTAGVGLGLYLMIHFGNYHFEPRPFVPGSINSKEVPPDAGQPTYGPITAPPKRDLVMLVVKLDQLLAKPAALHLTDAQRQQLLARLNGLEELSDEDAQKALDELMKLVESNKQALEAAGYVGPGTPSQVSGEEYRKHLESLRERLNK